VTNNGVFGSEVNKEWTHNDNDQSHQTKDKELTHSDLQALALTASALQTTGPTTARNGDTTTDLL